MKKVLFLIGGLLSSWAINAQNIENQAISYSDGAILLTKDYRNGTARFNAMSGAFGALGGDLSAMDINPAGASIFKKTEFALTFGAKSKDITSDYFGNSIINENNSSSFPQGGAVFVFNNNHSSNWSKFAIGLNFSVANNFTNDWVTKGNSSLGITPLADKYDPDGNYQLANEQKYLSNSNGRNRKFTLSFASELNNKIHLGAAIITHNVNFSQKAEYAEFNSSNDKKIFDVIAVQELYTTGNGMSLSAGIIAKPIKELRLGASVQSPTWYSMQETLKINQHEIFTDNSDKPKEIVGLNLSEFEYNISNPGRVTGSLAYIFDKQGLISIDYTYKDFSSLKLSPSADFIKGGENTDLAKSLKGASEIRIGGEYRIDRVSLRAGYYFVESPFKEIPNNSIKQMYGDRKGYSFGVGLKLGRHSRLDLAYQKSENQDSFKFKDVSQAKPANLDINTSDFTATLVFRL